MVIPNENLPEKDPEKCELCGCSEDTLYLHSRCHIQHPTWAVLIDGGKRLRIECAVCGAEVGTFPLATGESDDG